MDGGSKDPHKSSGAEFQGKLFMRLFMANQRNIYAFILSLVPNWADADDLMQETATVMWTKFGEFELGTNFLSWGMKVAYFEVLKFRKQRQRNRLQFTNELLETIAQDAVNIKTMKEVANCIGKSVESLYKVMARIHHSLLRCVQRKLAQGETA